MSDLMHLQEIADYCGISKDLVRREIAAKRLKARKTGKGWTTLRHIVVDFREEYYLRGECIKDKNAKEDA